MKFSRNEIEHIVRFGIVGTGSTFIHYGLYLLLLRWFNPSISYTGGYIIGFFFNYVLTTYFTFRSKSSIKKAAGFSVCHIINYFLELGVLHLFLWFGLEKQLAGIVTLVAVVPINYLILRFFYLWKR